MTLHPQAKAFVEMVAAGGRPSWEDLPIDEARETFQTFEPFFGEGPDLERVENYRTPEGISLRLYSASTDDAPVLMYFHGGGWVLGDLETHDSLCRRLAQHSQATVIAVDYGLSPENPFPGPIDDCYAATRYVMERSADLGIRPAALAVIGDSAGGYLATAVAMRSRDLSGPEISLQVLLYPVIGPSFETDSYREFADGFGLTRSNMKWFWQQFLRDRDFDAHTTPMLASLGQLPPALVITAQYDVLRDEGEHYARRLQESGNDVVLKRYDGMLHGFLHFAGLFDTALEGIQDIGQQIQDRLRG